MRKWLVIVWLAMIFSGIGALFYYNELIYLLPTPVPKNYRPIGRGKVIQLGPRYAGNSRKPVFLHFFNPDCPCSRFNIAQFKKLAVQYSTRVNFFVVVMSKKGYTAEEIKDKYGLNVPVIFDQPIATACGVYATPQAVIIDAQHKLFYRGNYNSSRYCTDEKTSYARLALNGLLSAHTRMVFNPLSQRAYGCSLPNCTN